MTRVRRHGRAIALAAAGWGLAMALVGSRHRSPGGPAAIRRGRAVTGPRFSLTSGGLARAAAVVAVCAALPAFRTYASRKD